MVCCLQIALRNSHCGTVIISSVNLIIYPRVNVIYAGDIYHSDTNQTKVKTGSCKLRRLLRFIKFVCPECDKSHRFATTDHGTSRHMSIDNIAQLLKRTVNYVLETYRNYGSVVNPFIRPQGRPRVLDRDDPNFIDSVFSLSADDLPVGADRGGTRIVRREGIGEVIVA